MFLDACLLLLLLSSLIYFREKQRNGAEIFSPLLSFSGLLWRLKVYPVRLYRINKSCYLIRACKNIFVYYHLLSSSLLLLFLFLIICYQSFIPSQFLLGWNNNNNYNYYNCYCCCYCYCYCCLLLGYYCYYFYYYFLIEWAWRFYWPLPMCFHRAISRLQSTSNVSRSYSGYTI